MPFNIPMGGFGGGAEIGSIYAKVGADLSDFDRGMAEAAMTMRATASEMRRSGSSISTDAEKAGRDVRRGFKDGERALSDFDRTARFLARDLNGGPFGLFGAIGSVGSGVFKLGGLVDRTAMSFATWATDAEQAGGMLGTLGTTAASIVPMIGALAGGAVVLGAALLVLPALAGAAAFALTFLLDGVTTLAAIVGGFIAPLTLFAGLVGLLGGGFLLAGERAIKGGGQFSAFATKVEHLTGQFQALVRTLASDFEPVFWRIANVAQVALNYFNKLAHMDNLRQAFRSLSTEGVSLLNKLVYGTGNLLARPFRMAIHFAFDSNGMAGAVSSWWTSLTNYLFGYTKTKTIHIGSRLVIDQKNVKGALDPIIKWFNRQHFTQTGLRWANEIIDGFIHSRAAKSLEQWASKAASNAGHAAGIAFRAALVAEITSFGSWMVSYFKSHWVLALSLPAGILQEEVQQFQSHWSSAWDWLKGEASRIWGDIVSLVESPLHVNIDWPSPPGWLSSLLGGGGPSTAQGYGGRYGVAHPRTGGLVMPGGALKLAGGGFVSGGTPGRDSVPALLTPGELVLNRDQQKRIFEGGHSGPMTLYLDLGAGIKKRIQLDLRQTARGLEARGKWGDH